MNDAYGLQKITLDVEQSGFAKSISLPPHN